MNILPDEIQNIIWKHYWHFLYKNVINEIEEPLKIEVKSVKFFSKYIGVLNTNYKSNYKHYFHTLNENIKSIVTNKGLMNIAKNNQLLLRYLTKDYIISICNNVPDHYKYIAGLFVIISGRNRFNTLHMFQNINIT